MVKYSSSDSVPAERPTVNQLLKHSDAGLAKRVAARYLFPNDAIQSERRHRLMGTPLVRKLIMNTIGYPLSFFTVPGGYRGLINYYLNANKGRMERVAEYTTKQSVFNETLHTVGIVYGIPDLIAEVQTESLDNLTMSKVWFAVNLGAVAVQRYNRARMVQFLDRRLQQGKRFDEEYKNWLQIDNRSIDRFNESQPEAVAAHDDGAVERPENTYDTEHIAAAEHTGQEID